MKLTKARVLLFFAVIVPPIFEFMPVTVRRGDEQTFTLDISPVPMMKRILRLSNDQLEDISKNPMAILPSQVGSLILTLENELSHDTSDG